MSNDTWATPQPLFDALDAEFHFDLDVCADATNAKCRHYFDEREDGLAQAWAPCTCWCNPPYSRGNPAKWLAKAHAESRAGATVVCLVKCDPSTDWWWQWAYRAAEIRLLRGRVRFEGAPASANFPNAVLVYRQKTAARGVLRPWDWRAAAEAVEVTTATQTGDTQYGIADQASEEDTEQSKDRAGRPCGIREDVQRVEDPAGVGGD